MKNRVEGEFSHCPPTRFYIGEAVARRAGGGGRRGIFEPVLFQMAVGIKAELTWNTRF